jgi:hypothetical protein
MFEDAAEAVDEPFARPSGGAFEALVRMGGFAQCRAMSMRRGNQTPSCDWA